MTFKGLSTWPPAQRPRLSIVEAIEELDAGEVLAPNGLGTDPEEEA